MSLRRPSPRLSAWILLQALFFSASPLLADTLRAVQENPDTRRAIRAGLEQSVVEQVLA